MTSPTGRGQRRLEPAPGRRGPGRVEEAVERWTTDHRNRGSTRSPPRRSCFGAVPGDDRLGLRARVGARPPAGRRGATAAGVRGGDYPPGHPRRARADPPASVSRSSTSAPRPGAQSPGGALRQRPAKLSVRPGLGGHRERGASALDLVFAFDGRPAKEVIRRRRRAPRRGPGELRALALEAVPELVGRGFVDVVGDAGRRTSRRLSRLRRKARYVSTSSAWTGAGTACRGRTDAWGYGRHRRRGARPSDGSLDRGHLAMTKTVARAPMSRRARAPCSMPTS